MLSVSFQGPVLIALDQIGLSTVYSIVHFDAHDKWVCIVLRNVCVGDDEDWLELIITLRPHLGIALWIWL